MASTAVALSLQDEGYHVTRSFDGRAGLTLVWRIQPDLILLDAALPGIDGITLCGAIRTQATTPIILFTKGSDELQRIIGLDRGADVCMVMPVSNGELHAQLRALLRRVHSSKVLHAQPINIGHLRIDLHKRQAWRNEDMLQLTPKEFELLAYLMRNHGLVLSRGQLLNDIWGQQISAHSQTLDVHIRWLRQKIEPNPAQPIYIQTVRTIGYRFAGP